MKSFRCADGHSVSAPRRSSLCCGVEGQAHPQRPHLVCQQFSQPTVHHPLSICRPSATTVCPVPTPLFTVSPTVCPSLPHRFKVSHSFAAQCVRQERASFAACLMKVKLKTKARHAPACSVTQTEKTKKINTMSRTHTHR